jgi:outer membrane protein
MKKEFFYIANIILLFSLYLSADAQENNNIPEKIGIDKAIRTAMENNQDYKIAVLREKQAGEKVNAAWGQLMPVLESEISGTRQSAESGFMSLTDGQNEIKFIQLRFGVNPGIFYNSLRLSQESHRAAAEDIRRIKALTEYSVVKTYFNVLLAGEIIKLRKDSMDVLKTNLADVRNMYRTGTVPRYELLQAEVMQRSQEPVLLEAESDFRTALDTFNFTLGFNTIKYVPDESILTQGNFKQPDNDADRIEHLTATALKNRPEVIQLEIRRDVARYSKNINNSYYLWPMFSIAGSYGLTQYLPNTLDIGAPPGITMDFSGISGTDEWQKTWQVRVAATYRWGAVIPADPTRAAGREEALKLREAEEDLNKLKRLIGISIRSNYSKLNTSCLSIDSQKRNVETALEGLRIARESYKAGIIKNSDLLSAELSLTNARTGYINAIYGYYVSLAELKKDIGIEDDRIILEDIK